MQDITWNIAPPGTSTMIPFNGYIAVNEQPTLLIPNSPMPLGATFSVVGEGIDFIITLLDPTYQYLYYNGTSYRTLTASNSSASITIVCIDPNTANQVFAVLSQNNATFN